MDGVAHVADGLVGAVRAVGEAAELAVVADHAVVLDG